MLLAVVLSAYAFASYSAFALAKIPGSEREALMALYNSTGGDSWRNKTGWLDLPGSECSWYGVTCDVGQMTVTGLDLSSNGLSGGIPADLGKLRDLEMLNLGFNSLTGSIPAELGNLGNLRYFNLGNNSLTGIPAELGKLTKIQTLWLFSNSLTAVKSGSTPYATALFSYRRNGSTVSEVGVPASPPTSSARFFVDYRTGTTLPGSDTKVDIYTGFSTVNRGSGSASVSFILRDPEGQILSRGTGSLDKDAHLAAYFNQLPDIVPGFSIDPSFPGSTQFGTLELSSDQPLSILALRLTTNQRGEMLMTSTPIADPALPSSAGPIYFPQLADGAGYSTTVVLLNTSSVVETGVLHLFANDGSPLTVRPVNGSSASSFNYSIPPGGVYVLQTDASPQDVQTGWMELIPEAGTSAPTGAGILQYVRDEVLVTETGIPSVVPTSHARIFLDTSGGHNTGMAIGNPGNALLNLRLQAFQMDGTTQAGVTNGPIALDAKGHAASFADQLVSGLPSGFQGVLDITGESPFAAITYRSLVNERGEILLTAFPVADLDQPPPSPILFPQIADGGGYATQIIVLNASGPSGTTLSFFGETGTPLALGKW